MIPTGQAGERAPRPNRQSTAEGAGNPRAGNRGSAAPLPAANDRSGASGSVGRCAVLTRSVNGSLEVSKAALDDIARRRLDREIVVLQRLSHPNVVELLRVTDTPGGPVAVLAYAGNHSLAYTDDLGLGALCGLLAATSRALADLHQLGWAHGGVEAGHVIVGEGGRITLCSLSEATHPADRALQEADRVDFARLVMGLLAERPDLNAQARRSPPRSDAHLRDALADLAADIERGDRTLAAAAEELAMMATESPSATTAPLDLGMRGLARSRQVAACVACALAVVVGVVLLALLRPRNTAAPSGMPKPAATNQTPDNQTPDNQTPNNQTPNNQTPDERSGAPAGGPPGAAVRATTTSAPTPTADGAVASVTVTSPTAVGCADSETSARADIDGDGCAEEIRITGTQIQAGDEVFTAGQPGDQLVAGDWDCDGIGTVVLLRPGSGEIFEFVDWPEPGAALSAPPLVVRPGAVGLHEASTEAPCAELSSTDMDGRRSPITQLSAGTS